MADDVVDRMRNRFEQLDPNNVNLDEAMAELAEVVRDYDAEFRTKAYAAEHAFRPGQAIHTMAADCLTCELTRHNRGVTS